MHTSHSRFLFESRLLVTHWPRCVALTFLAPGRKWRPTTTICSQLSLQVENASFSLFRGIMLDTTRQIVSWRRDSSSASPHAQTPMMRLKQIPMERRQRRIDGLYGNNGDKEVVSVLCLKQKTHLAMILFALCQYALMDPFGILPLGVISWCCSFTIALELLLVDTRKSSSSHLDILEKRRQQEYIRQQYDRILFEYRVLKQSSKRIVIVNDKQGRPSAIVAID